MTCPAHCTLFTNCDFVDPRCLLRPRDIAQMPELVLSDTPPDEPQTAEDWRKRPRARRNSAEARWNKQIGDIDYRDRTREKKRQYDRDRYATRKAVAELVQVAFESLGGKGNAGAVVLRGRE